MISVHITGHAETIVQSTKYTVTDWKEDLHYIVKNQTFQRIPTLISVENTIDATPSKDHSVFC